MDKSKIFIIVLIIIVGVIFVFGVLYTLGNSMLKTIPGIATGDPKLTYTEITNKDVNFTKTDTTSDIDYNFKIGS